MPTMLNVNLCFTVLAITIVCSLTLIGSAFSNLLLIRIYVEIRIIKDGPNRLFLKKQFVHQTTPFHREYLNIKKLQKTITSFLAWCRQSYCW